MRMRLVFKNTIKNIMASKGRSFLMIVLIVFASYTAMLALDMSGNIEKLVNGMFSYQTGTTDIVISGGFDPEYIDELPECDVLEVYYAFDQKYVMDPNSYHDAMAVALMIAGYSDQDLAIEMKQINEKFDLEDDEVILTAEASRILGIEEGDTIELTSSTKKTYEYTVKQIYKPSNYSTMVFGVYANPEVIRQLNSVPYNDLKRAELFIDIKDDSLVEQVCEDLKAEFPLIYIENTHTTADEDGMESITNAFYLIFLIAILLVGFVSISTSEKIVVERMSTIGTLRSLGVSNNKTAFILILENFVYSLIGSVIGGLLYRVSRRPFLTTMFIMEDDNGVVMDVNDFLGDTPFYIYLLMFVIITLLVCAYPTIELLKAVKTPIRDIIFNNKDTQYKYKKGSAYVGGVLVLVALVTALMNKSFVGMCISIVSIIVSMALLVPFMILGTGKLVEKLASNKGKVLLKFAARNMYNNKTIVGTSVLVVTSMMLSLLITNFIMGEYNSIAAARYDADVFFNENMKVEEASFLDNIPEINKYELIKSSDSLVSINGEEGNYCNVEAQGEYTMYHSQEDIKHELSKNETAIAAVIANRYDLKVGDEIEVAFNSDSFFPITKTLVVSDIISKDNYSELYLPVMLVNPELYTYLFGENFSTILIDCDDEAQMKDILYMAIPGCSPTTRTENDESIAEQTRSLRNTMTAIILFVSGLTFIGITGNQAMGFESRRREFAVLYSTAMSKGKMYKLLFIENIISTIIATIATWIGTPLLTRVFNSVMLILTDYDMPTITMDFRTCFTYTILIVVIFMLSTLIPIRRIRNMNTTEELKYE